MMDHIQGQWQDERISTINSQACSSPTWTRTSESSYPETISRATTPIRWTIAIRALSGKVGIIGKSTGRRHHLHLQHIGGSQEMAWTTTGRMAKSALVGKFGGDSLSEPSTLLQESCTFVFSFRVQTSANVVHATVNEDSTPRTRDIDDTFSSCVASRPNGQRHVDCLSPRAHQKLFVRLMFRGTLLESQFSSASYSSFCSTPPPTQTSLLNMGRFKKKTCDSARRSPLLPGGRTEPPHRLWAQFPHRSQQGAHADQLPFEKEQLQHRLQRSRDHGGYIRNHWYR